MPTILTTKKAIERSTFVIDAEFQDENDQPVTPNEMKWTLTDRHGTIVNSRVNIVIDDLDTTATIVLKGDDLVLDSPTTPDRVVVFEGTYDSTLGTGLPLRDAVEFQIVKLVEAKAEAG